MPSKNGRVTSSDIESGAMSEAGVAISATPEDVDNTPAGEQNPSTPDTSQIDSQENLDPLRQRIVNPGSRRLIHRLSRWTRKQIRVHIRHDLTAEELAEERDIQENKALYKTLKAEAQVAEGRMIECLARIGFMFERRDGKGNIKTVKKVKFHPVHLFRDELWFHVSSMPHKTDVEQLISQNTVTNLAVSVGHKVQVRWSEEAGIWFIIERASGTMGVPNHVNLLEMWERMPASKDALTVPFGYTNNRYPIFESLNDTGHMLIGGASGSGKSNFANVLLCTLIRRNKPGIFELLLVDFKGGIEFTFYKNIPHLKQIPNIAPEGIITEVESMGPLLTWIEGESQWRLALMTEAGVKDIGQYNAHRKSKRMPYMIVVIDEYAVVKLGNDSRDGNRVEKKLVKLLQTVRVTGITFIICTQIPQRDVLTTLVKGNLQTKVAFNCADLQGSMAILNNGHALGLHPKGRCVFRYQNEMEVQTPFIPLSLVQETVKGAITGEYGELTKHHDVTEQVVLEWALHENNGWLTQNKVFAHFKTRGLTWAELLSWLQKWEGQEFLIGSSMYTVEAGSNTRGRRLVFKASESEEGEKKE